jgi:hypothetical protein
MRAICSQSFDVPRVVVIADARDIDEASPILHKLAEMMPAIDLTTDLDLDYYLELLERDGSFPEAIQLAEFHWRLQKLPVPWFYRSLWRLYTAGVHGPILTAREAAEFAYLSQRQPAPAEETQIISLMSEVLNG